MSRCTAHILSTSVKFIVKSIKRSYSTIVMSKNRTLVLTVVRHGQTDSNKEKLMQGHVDNPLNDFGEKQAQAAGKALKNVIFHQAYSSDLKRAFKTCELILKENNASKINSENIVQDERIKEQHFGEFENAKLGDFIAAAIKANANPYEFSSESMESSETVKNRAAEFFHSVISKSVNLKEPSILMVAHGKVIQQLFKKFFEEMDCVGAVPGLSNPTDLLGMKTFMAACANTSWSKFVIDLEDEKIKRIECQELFNRKHLDELI